MAEPSTIARLYADAVFRLADAGGVMPKWSEMLAPLAAVAADARVRAAIKDPNLPDAKVAGLFISILGGKLNGDAENLVRGLAENGRLQLLPETRARDEGVRNERQWGVEAETQSPFDVCQSPATARVRRR